MKDIWLKAGTKGYEGFTPVMWCSECNDEREAHHTYCFDCGTELDKALRGPEINLPSDYERKIAEDIMRRVMIKRVK